jgi:hypothetical protein
MNPKPSPEITVETLLALRKENDAVRLITERLRVKEMGPADHIRTKHEVKAFVESGHERMAEQLLKHTQERLIVQHTAALKISQSHGQRV